MYVTRALVLVELAFWCLKGAPSGVFAPLSFAFERSALCMEATILMVALGELRCM